jgi:hypothetical protein
MVEGIIAMMTKPTQELKVGKSKYHSVMLS